VSLPPSTRGGSHSQALGQAHPEEHDGERADAAASAGPPIVAAWLADAEAATARGNIGSGTTLGSNDCSVGISRARAAPKTKIRAKIARRGGPPNTLPKASAAAVSSLTIWHATTIVRRSKLSATWPVTSATANIGTNWESPTRPRSNALPVSS